MPDFHEVAFSSLSYENSLRRSNLFPLSYHRLRGDLMFACRTLSDDLDNVLSFPSI